MSNSLKEFPVFVFPALLPYPNQEIRIEQQSHELFLIPSLISQNLTSSMMHNTKNTSV